VSTHNLPPEPHVTEALALEHGIKPDEYARLLSILGRVPSFTELGVYSAMWSEHCSYKSSKVWLRLFPVTAPWVICGPGENAGVIDIGDGQAAIFKMESHNHPSYIEPFQGAATGVGGILRDVFTMGARPVANLNALRFGDPAHPKTRSILAGAVAGIAHYGNCVGVPTVGGETNFHRAYNGNCLVNAMTVGVARQDRIFYSKAAGVGNPVVYVGSKTGRDGIHGAAMSSAEFNEDSEAKRPTVQVGDPFSEKLLIEACLELMETDLIQSIQDMGAAGLTSSAVEMAGKGGLGIELDLDSVPCREPGMTPYQIMLSESQERMLMVLKPGGEAQARAIFDKWDLDFSVIGHLTDTGRFVITMHGLVWCDLALAPLFDSAPLYQRPLEDAPKPAPLAEDDPAYAPVATREENAAALLTLLSCPDLASKRWIWEQYDSQVMADTKFMSGQADAAVVRVHGTRKGLALTSDVTPRYCAADPYEGGKQAVAEAWRNITTVGATPLAITDNMNFGNPEKPRIMAQFARCVEGMAEACRALDFPVVSGNVSLYNETNGEGILPTPTVGGVGLIADAEKAVGLAFKAEGEPLLLIGQRLVPGMRGHLGASLYLRAIMGREEGPPPPVDLAAERRHGELVRALIADGLIAACHDLSDGGLMIALVEMVMASGIGADISVLDDQPASVLYGEDQGRYLVALPPDALEQAIARIEQAHVPWTLIGKTQGHALTGSAGPILSLEAMRRAHEAWLPAYMGADAGT
jgi:phosphoribosylformylglycinamidine synthase subunit PurL